MAGSADSPSSAALVAVTKRRSSAAHQDPMIDVERVADELGVEVIHRVAMPQSGRTTRINGNYRIELAPHSNANRSRFTLAHEIGHVMLDALGLPLADQVRRPRVEATCNDFARHLLIPPAWLRRRPDLGSMRIAALSRLADETGVSLTAAFLAAARSRQWQAVLIRLFWDSADRRWAPLGVSTAVRPRVPVTTSNETYRALEELRGSGTWARFDLPLRVAGQAVRLPSEVRMGRAATVTALVDAAPAADWLRRMGKRTAGSSRGRAAQREGGRTSVGDQRRSARAG